MRMILHGIDAHDLDANHKIRSILYNQHSISLCVQLINFCCLTDNCKNKI